MPPDARRAWMRVVSGSLLKGSAERSFGPDLVAGLFFLVFLRPWLGRLDWVGAAGGAFCWAVPVEAMGADMLDVEEMVGGVD